jgi:hypothetical protein
MFWLKLMVFLVRYRCSSPTPWQPCIGSSTWQTWCGPPHFCFAWHGFGSVDPWPQSLPYGGWGPVGVYGGLIGWSPGYFWWHFIASLAWVLLNLPLCALAVISVVWSISFVELLLVLLGDVRREFSHATPLCCSSRYPRFLSPRRFAGGQCWCCAIPSSSSDLGFSLFYHFCFGLRCFFL